MNADTALRSSIKGLNRQYYQIRVLSPSYNVNDRMLHQSKAETLVLGHFIARSLKDPGNSPEKISLQFSGEIIFAEDLQSLALGKSLN